MNTAISRVSHAIETLKQGKMIVVMDDQSRENEGDIIIAAQFATQENINFMLNKARGLICAPLLADSAERLNLMPMISSNEDPHKTAFTVSIDHRSTHTGISAVERALTLREMANPQSTAQDFNRPGHIFPLIAKAGGVLERPGHTEATTDLLQLAGLTPIGVICEVLKDDGTMAREADLRTFCQDYALPFLSIADIAHYQRCMIIPLSQATLPTEFGNFTIYTFPNSDGGEPHLALIKQGSDSTAPATVRIHSECLTGDVFHSKKCDCAAQLHFGLAHIAKAANGVLLYLRQEGRGIGLVEKIKAYALQEQGQNTIEANLSLGHVADGRDYRVAGAILRYFNVQSVRLITNNPLKIEALENAGISVMEQLATPKFETPENAAYLAIKSAQMGHLL